MKTSRTQLARIVADGMSDGSFDRQKAKELAAYLLEERRTGDVMPLLRDVQRLRTQAGVVEVVAYSAHELTKPMLDRIETEATRLYPHAKQVLVTHRRDTTLIGGIRLEFADYRLDLSVAGELRKFKTLAFQGKDYR